MPTWPRTSALAALSMNVVSANAARPSGPGSAGLQPAGTPTSGSLGSRRLTDAASIVAPSHRMTCGAPRPGPHGPEGARLVSLHTRSALRNRYRARTWFGCERLEDCSRIEFYARDP